MAQAHGIPSPVSLLFSVLSLAHLLMGKEHHWHHLSANIQQNLRNRSLTVSKISSFLPVEWRSGFKKHFTCACSVAQSCPTLRDSVDCNPPGSSDPRISQTGILEWVAISGDLPDPGIKPKSPETSALAGGFFTTEPLGKPNKHFMGVLKLFS